MLMKLKFTIFKFAKQNPTPPEPRNCVRLWGNAMKSGNDLPKSLKKIPITTSRFGHDTGQLCVVRENLYLSCAIYLARHS